MKRRSAAGPLRFPFSRRHGLGMAGAVVLGLLALASRTYWRPFTTTEPIGSHFEAYVARVVDGDTFIIESPDKVRVRMIGVDTPETVKPNHPIEPFGPEAAAYTRQAIEGKTVILELDQQKYDKYDRLLAYVWSDGRLLNEELLREGLGKATLQYDFAADRKELFRRAEAEARAARCGIWSLPQH